MDNQPKWEMIMSTDYSRILIDKTGQYAPEMEICQEIHDSATDEDSGNDFEVFRFSLDQLYRVYRDNDEGEDVCYITQKTYIDDPVPFQEWFMRDLKAVADCCGTTRAHLVNQLCSPSASERSGAYEDIGSYHGFMNFDSYPLTMKESELNIHWEK